MRGAADTLQSSRAGSTANCQFLESCPAGIRPSSSRRMSALGRCHGPVSLPTTAQERQNRGLQHGQ